VTAALSLLLLFVSVLTVLANLFKNKAIIPTTLSIMTFVACIGQIVTVSVYGAIGLRDNTQFDPDYSFILACVAIGVDLIAAFLFGADALYFHRMYYFAD
jgi:hypothetical protein